MHLSLGFLASHRGTSVRVIFNACRGGQLEATVCAVVSNNSGADALKWARQQRIPCYHLSTGSHPDPEELDKAIATTFLDHGVNLVVLSGYMRLLGPHTVSAYRRRILNIHPALLPRFGGQGMYGRAVHEAVIASGEATTGITIHFADEQYDHGSIISQCSILVRNKETVDELSERVSRQEGPFFVQTLIKIARGEIDLDRI